MRNSLEYNIDFPLDITNFNGVNIPWLIFESGEETSHDGYGNGFDNAYFNGVNANTSIQAQLDILETNNVGYIRLWLNIYAYMNADKATVGYTAFREGFLTNLATYCDWCNTRGIKMLISLDDCWSSFPWLWIADETKKASYIQACKDVVTALKDKPAVWGWDYCNEPYMGWSWSDLNDTTRKVFGVDGVDVGYTRETLTDYFIELYPQLKAITPTHYFSVGHVYPANSGSKDLLHWDIASCSDFYQYHHYSTNPTDLTVKYSDYDKPVIIGEWGYDRSGYYMSYPDFSRQMLHKFFQLGFPLVMGWNLSEMIERTGVGAYSANKSLTQTRLWQE